MSERSAHEEWVEFQERCLPPGTDPETVKYTRRIFYTGLLHGVSLAKDADAFFFRRLQREMEMLNEDMKEGRA